MKLTPGRQIQSAFILALLMLLTLGFFAYYNADSLREALKWEEHTQKTLLQLDDTLSLAIDAETGGRGFIITGNDSFLEPFNQTEQKINQNLTDLRRLISNNPKQTAELGKLETLVGEKLKFTGELIEIRRTRGLADASDIIESGRGKKIMNLIRLSVNQMKDEEKANLKMREDDLDKSISNTLFILFFGTGAGIISLVLANLVISRENRKRQQAEEDLRVANKSLEKRVAERTEELLHKNDELEDQIKQRELSEQRRRIALEAGSLGTWTVENESGTAEVDERSLSIFGLAADSFDGTRKTFFSRIYEEDLPEVDEAFHKSFAERKNFSKEFRVKMPDGKIVWNHCIGQPQFDENGKVTRIVGHCRDVTDTKSSELALRRSEQNIRNVIDNLFAYIAVLSPEGFVLEINRTALEMSQPLDAVDIIGRHFAETVWWNYSEEVKHKFYDAIERAADGERVRFDTEMRVKNDKFLPIDFMIAPLFDENGVIHLIASGVDLTTRKQAEAEREELLKREKAARKDAEIANRLRDEFLATVSHELRAPLNAILGWGRLLEKGTLDEKTSEKAVNTIVRNAESQNRLIEDLLDVSRIISGKLRLEIITIKPINIVESAFETVRPAAEAKNITLEIKEDSDVSHISGDPNRLQQVLWNLLSNAIKFTPNDGRVMLEIERSDGFVELHVKDSGVGIKQEFLPHVFDRFRQADASSIRKFGGLGLGLAIVRHITEMHGGTVHVESAGENLGSTFTVRLPLVNLSDEDDRNKAEKKREEENLALDSKLNLDGLLVLVVDDEEDTRQLLVQSLTFYGATVISARSAEQALEQISDKNPDVLVSDIGMPEEDGYSLIRKVRNLPNEQHSKIQAVALTAFTRAQDRVRALSFGYQNHVSKPVEPDELATVIASLTGRLQLSINGEEPD